MEESQGTQTNEQTAEVVEPIQKVGGESAASFDELERLHDSKKESKSKDSQADAKPKQEAKSENKKELSKEDQLKTDEIEKKEGSQEQKEVKKELKDQKVATYKVKQGDQALDLRDDATVRMKINDKWEDVSFKDIRENYAGKVAWDKKFTEVDRKDKEVQKQANVLSNAMKTLVETSKTDPYAAFLQTIEYAGLDPQEVQVKFLAQVMDSVDKFQKMSEGERKEYEKQLEIDKYKKKAESYESREKQQEELRRTQEELVTLQKEYDLKDEDISQAYEELVSMKTKNEIKGEITPKLLADFANDKRLYKAIGEFLTEIDESLLDNDGAVEELASVYKANKGLSLEKLKEIAIEVYGSDKAKTLNRKIKKSMPTDTSKPQARKEAINPNVEAITFDQL
jgi:hypothetical protein